MSSPPDPIEPDIELPKDPPLRFVTEGVEPILKFIRRFKLPFKLSPQRFFILLYLAVVLGGSFFVFKAWTSNSEFGACIDIYDDPTLSPEIRAHCTKVVEDWRAERDAVEAKEKQDYIENFEK